MKTVYYVELRTLVSDTPLRRLGPYVSLATARREDRELERKLEPGQFTGIVAAHVHESCQTLDGERV